MAGPMAMATSTATAMVTVIAAVAVADVATVAVAVTVAVVVIAPVAAAAVAVAMADRVGAKAGEKVVCVVSGGHIDATVLAEILSGVEEWNEDDVAIAKL